MGQYYKPAFLANREIKKPQDVLGWFYSHNHKVKYTREDGISFVGGHGLKLMEHSYIGNAFVSEVERHLIEKPKRLVWAGDYADGETVEEGDFKDVIKERREQGYLKEDEKFEPNIYDLCGDDKEIKPATEFPKSIGKRFRYIVNHDKQQFVDKSRCPEIPDWEGAYIHPLPLLTCEGNGRGGGDFRREPPHPLVGAWARDLISIESRRPKGFIEIVPNFQEE